MKPTRRQFIKGAKNLAVSASPAGRALNKAGTLLTKPVTRKVGVYLSDHIVGDFEMMSEYKIGVWDVPVEKKTGLYSSKFGGKGGPDLHEIEYKRPELKDPHLEFRSLDSDDYSPYDEKIGEIDVPDLRFEGDIDNLEVKGDPKQYITDADIRSYQLGDSDYGYKDFGPQRLENIKSALSKGRKLLGMYEEAQRVKSLYENTEGKPKQIENKPKEPQKSSIQKRIEHSTKGRTALSQKPSSGINWGEIFKVGASRLSGIGLGLELASHISPGGSVGDASLENWYKKNARKSSIPSSRSR
jgi:hypothetical protein